MTRTISALALAAAMAVAGPGAQAGGLAAPVMPPEVIVEETTSASHDWVVPLLALALLVAVVSSSGTAGGAVVSDIRLKTDVARIGTTAHGLPLYRFSYVGQPEVYEGVMAQDVAKVMPDAIVALPGGYMGVNYDMLGLAMKRVH